MAQRQGSGEDEPFDREEFHAFSVQALYATAMEAYRDEQMRETETEPYPHSPVGSPTKGMASGEKVVNPLSVLGAISDGGEDTDEEVIDVSRVEEVDENAMEDAGGVVGGEGGGGSEGGEESGDEGGVVDEGDDSLEGGEEFE